jgi:hypothetical protein
VNELDVFFVRLFEVGQANKASAVALLAAVGECQLVRNLRVRCVVDTRLLATPSVALIVNEDRKERSL